MNLHCLRMVTLQLLLLTGMTATAHHSNSQYDVLTVEVMTGVVTSGSGRTPHRAAALAMRQGRKDRVVTGGPSPRGTQSRWLGAEDPETRRYRDRALQPRQKRNQGRHDRERDARRRHRARQQDPADRLTIT
jgi:hypothetical protein